MAEAVFCSDVHLDPADPAKTARFASFLEAVLSSGAPDLYVLGDLFHFWIGDEHADLPDYAPVLARFEALRDAGVRVHFLHGNRDFTVGRGLRDRLGWDVWDGPKVVRCGPFRVRLAHGDMLCARDYLYRIATFFLRSDPARRLFRALPVSWRYRLAGGYRRFSEGHVAGKSAYTLAIVNRVAWLALRDADVLVCGHVHRPLERRMRVGGVPKTFYTLGHWDDRASYLVFDAGRFALYDGAMSSEPAEAAPPAAYALAGASA